MTHPAFELLRREPVESLNLTVEFYRHIVTGARHVHLVVDDPHNAFLVGFLTVPTDSTGVAHILEHTALCGSQRFPVRDPFFMMTRRSLATFMNAVTGNDWTAYPFSSLSRKDFDNLMQVYLDAAFFPTLQPLDFAQEGYRIELAQPDDVHSPLVYKGVVFNEMKGASSSPARILGNTISHHLFPTLTYRYDSGGDPAEIPDLTWEALRAFHARHYHPSNAIFMTFGDIPAAEHQAVFQERVLHAFTGMPVDVQVPDEQRLTAPIRVTAPYAVDGTDATANKTYIVLGWLLGRGTNPEESLKAHLLNGVLLDNSASPLLHALETTELGSAPAPICGMDTSSREMVFCCGIEGSEPEHADAVEEMILTVLRRVATDGVPLAQVEAVLHQLELSRREIGGEGWPYGLNLLLTALSPKLHLSDVPVDLRIPVGTADRVGHLPLTWHPCTTNRLVYQQVILETPGLPDELLDLLPLFSSCLTEVGCGGRDYLQTQVWQSTVCGGISAQTTVRGGIMDAHHFRSLFTLSAKALTRNQEAMARLVRETLKTPRFDEHNRLRELVAQMRAAAETRVTNNGHALAILAASAAINPVAAIHDRWGGLSAIARLKQLDNALDDPQALARFARQLEEIRDRLSQAPAQLLVAGEAPDFAAMADTLRALWATEPEPVGMERLTTHPVGQQTRMAWSTVTTVHFCAKAYPAVPYAHPDAPALSVLGPFLKNGFLHKAIRERGGAYGSGAGLDTDSGTFRFFSYRDPRLTGTLADFDRSLAWLAETSHDPETLEQAILNVIGAIDRPGSPAGDARRAFHDALHGRTPEQRRLFRSRVLQVTMADLQRVAATHLQPAAASLGIVSNAITLAKEAQEGWEIRAL
ncbi:MAG: insulinase family protein, partial [Magnetococcus sp. DMHC-8]